MARDPGEWYEEKRQEAERLEAQLDGARAVLDAMRAARGQVPDENLLDVAIGVVKILNRRLERARYVGD